MKVINKIAKAELQVLFYSPVAWLVIIIFMFQSSLLFTDLFANMVKTQAMGREVPSATLGTFAGMLGFYAQISKYLYLYIPLLTMGVMSREYNNGSIKLLLSSPISSFQIILGKYLALVGYALILTAITGIFAGFAIYNINQVDAPVVFAGLLGIFLQISAYAAIGLFMSSITSYTVVSAIGTLAILAFLGYISGLGQDIALVRDITYWLSISGRADAFFAGVISAEDVLYYLLIVSLFIGFAILRLNLSKIKTKWYLSAAKYALVFIVAAAIGYVSTRPTMMAIADVTRNKTNTVSRSSQAVLKNLDQQLTITTYVNMLAQDNFLALPIGQKVDMDRFKQYLRFRPDIKLNYEYYYHKAFNPWLDKKFEKNTDEERLDSLRRIYDWTFAVKKYDELPGKPDLSTEDFQFVRVLELANGKKTFLRVFDDMMRYPSEAEITSAMKRLLMDLPIVGFATGHGERSSKAIDDRGYNKFAQEKRFRYALLNQGFDFKEVDLNQPVPKEITVLFLAEPRQAYNAGSLKNIQDYIDAGGNLILASEPDKVDFINPIAEHIGVKFLPGVLVDTVTLFDADLMRMKPTAEARPFSFHLDRQFENNLPLTMPGASALEVVADKGFTITTLFRTDSTTWREFEDLNFIDSRPVPNPAAGEIQQSYTTVLAMTKQVNGKEQKILVTGDADWISNGELTKIRPRMMSANSSLINAAFYWLSNEEVPIDTRRDPALDKSLSLTEDGFSNARLALKWIIPALLILLSVGIWIRRSGR
ncbi:Gldg family protein [Sphingobacterium sp. Mn56C]|uniref:Gldg family protein n=1 Tax=Sphingobacterium sp. Mn56C TaxID=3395261 RepID=UPI003BCCEAE8